VLAELAKEGVEPVVKYSFPRGAFAYVNSDEIGGIMFELFV